MKDTMIGVDLAKNVFQLHGTSMTGVVKYRKKLSRGQFSRFTSEQRPALVVMEACGSAHYWARELVKLGHAVKLIPPAYVPQCIIGTQIYGRHVGAIMSRQS